MINSIIHSFFLFLEITYLPTYMYTFLFKVCLVPDAFLLVCKSQLLIFIFAFRGTDIV